MQPWIINILSTIASLVMTPVVIFLFFGWPAQQSSNPFLHYPTSFGPSVFYPKPPPAPTWAEKVSRHRLDCKTQLGGNSLIQPEYRDKFCECIAPKYADTANVAARQQAANLCREQITQSLSSRTDLAERFSRTYDQFCTANRLDDEGRISEGKTRETCVCISDRVRQSPVRMAAFAYAGGERWEGQLNKDFTECAIQVDALKANGWRVETVDGRRSGVLTIPAHKDISDVILSCNGDQLQLALRYWPSGKAQGRSTLWTMMAKALA